MPLCLVRSNPFKATLKPSCSLLAYLRAIYTLLETCAFSEFFFNPPLITILIKVTFKKPELEGRKGKFILKKEGEIDNLSRIFLKYSKNDLNCL